MLRYAIIGFGGLGRVHLGNLVKLNEERGDLSLCAICGTTEENFKKSVSVNFGTFDCSHIDISNCHFYDDYKELIDKEKPDFVVSALPTYLHEEVAVYALTHGCHILSEKPMALSVESCQKMIDAANANKKLLMIGQCCRFAPVYTKLKEYVDTGVFGKPYRAEFARYSQTPLWTWNNWILNPEMSGGCVIDMHIHDTDLVNYIFGIPKSVHSIITNHKAEMESVYSQYIMPDGMVVLNNADWSLPQKFPFEDRVMVVFEKACVVINGESLVVYTDEETITPELTGEGTHITEMREFLDCIDNNRPSTIMNSESIMKSIKLGFIEIESSKTGKTIELNPEMF